MVALPAINQNLNRFKLKKTDDKEFDELLNGLLQIDP